MTPEQFFEQFELFADAPNAVAKMRQLVLHLAVTGKIVTQDPSDESGEWLLEKILEERTAAVKASLISPIKALPPVGDGEISFSIPRGWAQARLIDLVMEIQTGPFGSSLHKSDYQRGGTPVINPASLKAGGIVPIDEMAIGPQTVKRLAGFKLAAGDIVMARRGEMGRCAIVTKREEGWLCGTGSLALRMPKSMYASYLAMLIGAPMSREYLGDASVGATMQNLNQTILAKMPVGVPPLAEQMRIVAKVDELMALCDRLEAQQQERETRHAALARASLTRFADEPTPANLDFLFHDAYAIAPVDLRKAILTLAVQGKLVPQNPKDGNAFDDLNASNVDLNRWKVAESERRYIVPETWAWMRFAGVGEQRLGKMLDATKNKGFPKPYLRNTNVQWMRFKLDDVKEMRVEEREEDELKLRKGDLLICEGGEPGRCAIWNDEISEMYFQKALHRVRPCNAILAEFLALNLRIDCQNDVLTHYFTGATIKHLTGRSLDQYPIPIPPLAEQRRIVAKVGQLMALVDQLEAQLTQSRAAAEKLMEAVVGELTAQH